jgi:type II secretory pathway pseudopilin PulG
MTLLNRYSRILKQTLAQPQGLQAKGAQAVSIVGEPAGFSIAEPLVVSVIVVLVMAASAVQLAIANRRFIATQQRVVMQREIDTNIQQIKVLARRYTCCSGVCTTTVPTTLSTTTAPAAPNRSCITNDWRRSTYYYPAIDDPSTTANFAGTSPATPSELNAVDQICESARNNDFLAPLQTSMNTNAPAPGGVNWTRTITPQSEKVLRVTYRDTINNVDVRTVYLRPAMAGYCFGSS